MDPNTNQAPQPGAAPAPGSGTPPEPQLPPSSPPVGPAPGGASAPGSGPEVVADGAAPAPVGPADVGHEPGWQPDPNMPTMSHPADMPAPAAGAKKMPMWLLALIIGVVVLVVVLAGYFLFFAKNDRSNGNNAAKKSSNAAKNAVALATLTNVTINSPVSMPDTFKANDLGVATVKDYSYDNGNCDLQFGTLTAAQLPGADVGDILAKQIKSFRDAGATVNGPNTADALLIKDSASSAVYSMPTLSMSFKKDNRRAVSHYSAVVLKGGNRAFVSRSCVNTSGEVNMTTFNAVDAQAKNLTLTKQ